MKERKRERKKERKKEKEGGKKERGSLGQRRVAFAGNFVTAVGRRMQFFDSDHAVGNSGIDGKDADGGGG